MWVITYSLIRKKTDRVAQDPQTVVTVENPIQFLENFMIDKSNRLMVIHFAIFVA